MLNTIPYKHLSVLIIPTDYCNMNCVYCFNSRRTRETGHISEEILKKVFDITIPFYDDIKFIWHGGEPLSMGIDFFRKAFQLQKDVNHNHIRIKNSIQTNLTLITDEMADFLIKEDVHLGSSYDGLSNEKTRHNSDKILEGRRIFLEHGGKCGFIYVVQKNNIDNLQGDYEWFRENGINYSLNPYLCTNPSFEDALSVPEEYYAEKMNELFRYWFTDQNCGIRISTFLDLIEYILYGKKSICCYNSCLGKHIGVLPDGRIFNCNRDFPEEYCFGNVLDYDDIHECFNSDGFNRLLHDAVERRRQCKESCELFPFCAGGCNSSAYAGGDIRRPNEYMCHILAALYKTASEMADRYITGEQENEKEINPTILDLMNSYRNRREY